MLNVLKVASLHLERFLITPHPLNIMRSKQKGL